MTVSLTPDSQGLGRRYHPVRLERETRPPRRRARALRPRPRTSPRGCASGAHRPVRLNISQTSVAPTTGFSVTASCHFRSVQIPAATVPRRASTGPSELLLRLGGAFRSLLDESEASRMRLRRKRRGRGQSEKSGRRRVVGVDRRHDAVLQDPPRGVGIRLVEVDTWSAPAERLVRSDVSQDVAPSGNVREVDDQVGSLRQAQQYAIAIVGGDVHRCRENPPSLPICHTSTGTSLKSRIEARLAVQEAESVAALLDLEERRVPVHHDRVPEELGIPDRRERPDRNVGVDDSIEELAVSDRTASRPPRRTGRGSRSGSRYRLFGGNLSFSRGAGREARPVLQYARR